MKAYALDLRERVVKFVLAVVPRSLRPALQRVLLIAIVWRIGDENDARPHLAPEEREDRSVGSGEIARYAYASRRTRVSGRIRAARGTSALAKNAGGCFSLSPGEGERGSESGGILTGWLEPITAISERIPLLKSKVQI